jgi:type IV pilus assembly protein PilQ
LGFTQGGLLSGQLAGLQTDAAQTEHLNVNLPALPIDLSPISLAMNLAQFGQQHIDAELSALEGQGKAEIIASPRLLTANQEESSIATGKLFKWCNFCCF